MDEGAMKGHDRDARWGDVIMRETWGPGEGRGKAIKTNIITRKRDGQRTGQGGWAAANIYAINREILCGRRKLFPV